MINTEIKEKYDWKKIQKYYDEGNSCNDVMRVFDLLKIHLHRAKKYGIFKPRTQKEGILIRIKNHGPSTPIQSEETKKKLSKIRIEYLTEHPDKVPYIINHSSKKSWPEEVFENALKSSNIIGWEYKYRNGIYEYDFAFVNQKIDVEIDGGTHKTEKVKKIDKRRDEFSIKNGWKVLRFEAERVKKDVIGCINELKTIL